MDSVNSEQCLTFTQAWSAATAWTAVGMAGFPSFAVSSVTDSSGTSRWAAASITLGSDTDITLQSVTYSDTNLHWCMKYFDLTLTTPLTGVTSPLSYTVSATDSHALTAEVLSDTSCTDVTLTYEVHLFDNAQTAHLAN